MSEKRVGVGGGCHWCTEAVFQVLLGVSKVEQGWLASTGEHSELSEGVIVTYEPSQIALRDLVEVHLQTHSSSSDHSLRSRYRSAIYSFDLEEIARLELLLRELEEKLGRALITKALEYSHFRASRENIRDYYKKRPDKPFCSRHIEPKLEFLLEHYPWLVDHEVLPILTEDQVLEKIVALPNGFKEVKYRDRAYGLRKESFNEEQSFKVYAEELGGRDHISLNFYQTSTAKHVRPCEMPLQKVLAFLRGMGF